LATGERIVSLADKKLKAAKKPSLAKKVKIRRCKLTKKQQQRMIEFFVLGVTARSAADLMGMQPNTAALFYRKIREVIAHYLSIEAQQTFNGDFRLNPSISTQDKQAIFGMLTRDGKVFTKMTGQVDSHLLTSANPSLIAADSLVFSNNPDQELTLDVNECYQEHVGASNNPTDETENFWDEAKRILRKYNGIPKSTFPLFLKECEFRFNYGSPKEQLKMLKLWTGL
jgi:transposase